MVLQYDDNAFHFFCLSLSSVYLVPAWFSILGQIFKGLRTNVDKNRSTKALTRESDAASLLSSKGFRIKLTATIALTFLLACLIYSVLSQDGDVESFDPFEILGIDRDADLPTIKKAYRQLSRKYHEDHNPNDPTAKARSILINKAKEALTDETARECWERTGNPDCNGSFSFGFGLPSFLVEARYRNLVLMGYLVAVVGLVPFLVWKYYSESRKFGDKNVMYDTYSWFNHALNDGTALKSLPEVLAGCAEFRQSKVETDDRDMTALVQLVRPQMQKPQYKHPVCIRGNVLLHAYLQRKTASMKETDYQALTSMLRKSSLLIDAMVAVCKHRQYLQTMLKCIEFGQCITQAMWGSGSSLLQLPHFTDNEVKHCRKGKHQAGSITEYKAMPENQRKGMAEFSDKQKKDVSEFLERILPDLSMETRVFVDDDDDDRLFEQDLLTVQVTLTRHSAGSNEGWVHAPHYPFPKRESFWIILGQAKEGQIVHVEKVTIARRKKSVHQIKFLAPPQGTYEFDLWVKSADYVGIDQHKTIEITTLDSSTLPEYTIHPDDAGLDDEPTVWEQMMQTNIEDDSDDEESDDEDIGDRAKKVRLRNNNDREDDDSTGDHNE